MASNSGLTALVIIGVGVGGYTLYRMSKRGHGSGSHHAGWFLRLGRTGTWATETSVTSAIPLVMASSSPGRGGGGGGMRHYQPQQQPDMSQQGGGDGGEFGQSPQPYQQPPFHHPHGFGGVADSVAK